MLQRGRALLLRWRKPAVCADFVRRRRAHYHKMQRRGNTGAVERPFLLRLEVVADGVGGLMKRPRAMRFVQNNQTVICDHRGMDRGHARRTAIRAEQKARANLIHRSRDDGRLRVRSWNPLSFFPSLVDSPRATAIRSARSNASSTTMRRSTTKNNRRAVVLDSVETVA